MLIAAGLFVVNLFIPDPFPFVDEILLLIATILIGSFKRWRDERGDDAGEPTDADRSGEPSD